MISHAQPSRWSAPSAQAIAEAARQRLANSPYRSIQRLSCEVEGRILMLHGQLPSFYQNQLAQETVAGIEGVDRVVNLVEVASEPKQRVDR